VKVLPEEVAGPIQTPSIEQENPFRYPKERYYSVHLKLFKITQITQK
jgi:hypothetical protein